MIKPQRIAWLLALMLSISCSSPGQDTTAQKITAQKVTAQKVTAQESKDRPSATEEIRQRGKLVMLCFPSLAGGVSPNLEHGTTRRVGTADHFIGLEVSLIQILASRLGVELEIMTLGEPGYEPLIPALLEGKADLVASTLSITQERERIVDFSKPYDFAYQVVVTRQASEIRTAEDLPGKIPVTAKGSSHRQHLNRLGIDDANMRFVDFVEEYYTLLADGEADFAVVDSLYPDRLDELQNTPAEEQLKVAFALPDVDRIAAAVPPGSDLKEHLDAMIEELDASGELNAMRKQARAKRADLM